MLTIKQTCLAGAIALLMLGSASATAAPATQTAAAAAATPSVSTQTYANAEKFLRPYTTPLVSHLVREVHWLDDTHFWYVDRDANGMHYKVMDAATGKVQAAFDQDALAAALDKLAAKAEAKKKTANGKAADHKVNASKLLVSGFQYVPQGKLKISWHGRHLVCKLVSATPKTAAGGNCVPVANPDTKGLPRGALNPANGALSPNGKLVAFVRDWNLWVRNVATGKDTQLTFDGKKNDGYATRNAGWVHGKKGAIVRWSPDSKKIATYRQDQRKVGNMYTISTGIGHPTLESWKYPMPGDKHVFMIQPVVIDVATKKMVKLKMQPEQRLSTLCDTLACGMNERQAYKWSDVRWAPDSKTFAFVTTSRNRQHEWFRIAEASTGKVHTGFHFTAKDYYESGHGMVNWQYLPKTDQAIWPTVQNNWLNLYLYNLKTGKQVRAITKGRGNVDMVLRFDRKTGTIWFVGNARESGINPYFKQFFKVDIKTGKTTLLTPQPADHNISMSPGGKYFVDSYSTVDQPPITVLRSSKDGHVIATIAKADISKLKATGWQPPKVIKVSVKSKLLGHKTTLYGLLFKPTNFDPHKSYPIIDYIYPGPQTGSVFSFGWASARGDHQAMAELGFVVVAINGVGTPWRSAAFHKAWYGDMGNNTLPSQIAALKALAKKHPWINLQKVGIWGHSGGGNATADALFTYPDFFKVGWAESGNHDNRNYENDWGEKYQGLLVKHADGTTNYDNQANELIAKNLKGHLMLVHGAIDDNVPHSNTFLVVDALIKANKNFDMMILPNEHHGYGADRTYVMRRRWDYFVRYLMGATPPHEFKITYPKSGFRR